SSFGVAEGGRVVSAALAPGTRAGGSAGPEPSGLVAPRSSGSPGARPPAGPTGASLAIGNWPPPSARGAPGAFGFWFGSKASPRRRPRAGGAAGPRLSGGRRGRFLHDRRGRRDLRLLVARLRLRIGRLSLRVARLSLGLPRERIGLN